MRMDYKKANVAFFFMVLSTFVIMVYISFWQAFTGRALSLPANNALCELMILIPAVSVIMYSGEGMWSVIPFKKVKIGSAILSVLYVITLFPLVAFVNAISMLFVDNAVASVSNQIIEHPVVLMLASIGLFGPFVEEIVFRGVIYQSYRRTGRILASMILSAVLFGMMHLNFNQFAYGAVMGFMFCLMVEATGSVLPSFIAHAVFNSIEVISIYVGSGTAEEIEDSEGVMSQFFPNMSEGVYLVILLCVLCVAAVISTAIAIIIVNKMAAIEGRKSYLDNLKFRKKNQDPNDMNVAGEVKVAEKKQSLFTAPLVIVMILAICFMFYSAVALQGV